MIQKLWQIIKKINKEYDKLLEPNRFIIFLGIIFILLGLPKIIMVSILLLLIIMRGIYLFK